MGDEARLERIAAIYAEGHSERAITQLKAYVQAYPQDDLAWTILGNAYQDVDRLDNAQQAYESALAANPRQFKAITGQGILHRKRGEYDAAMQAYQQALAIDPAYAQAYSSMTAIALKRHEDEKALEYASKGYDLDQSNPVIAANLALAYHYNNDIDNRDKFTRIAERLGYHNMDTLHEIYSGESTIRD
jgi:tetratricopeptide (TPR) repeat protein